MTRRGFLASLSAGAFALDPERALWIPGARVYSIPPPRLADIREVQRMWNRMLSNAMEILDYDPAQRDRLLQNFDAAIWPSVDIPFECQRLAAKLDAMG